MHMLSLRGTDKLLLVIILLPKQRPRCLHLLCRGRKTCVSYTGVRSAAGLGQAEAGDRFASRQLRQVLGLLLGRAEQQDAFETNRLKNKQTIKQCDLISAIGTS